MPISLRRSVDSGSQPRGRGLLFHRDIPPYERIAPPTDVADRLQWVWVPRWDVPSGVVLRPKALVLHSMNLIVDDRGHVTVLGPSRNFFSRELRGQGWLVGIQLRPASTPALFGDPAPYLDGEVPRAEPSLGRAAVESMTAGPEPGPQQAVTAVAEWARARIPIPDARGRLANRMVDLIHSDTSIARVDELADGLGVSPRTLQRLSRRYLGVSPLAVIRRHRLHETLERIGSDRAVPIAQIAAEMGYADHAHLTTAFRHTLELTPSQYRRLVAAERHAPPD
ncbi:AraC family transcriptional regulator [Agromyces silvae]|uniref:AraC family transcriptional regulator n=1 Tax=Agromyces silvae TaxID=3388266 RepID=UPI00280A60D9|nr:helix-turn-helix domain-containing protein [Agromyces protaetiae]